MDKQVCKYLDVKTVKLYSGDFPFSSGVLDKWLVGYCHHFKDVLCIQGCFTCPFKEIKK